MVNVCVSYENGNDDDDDDNDDNDVDITVSLVTDVFCRFVW